MRLFDSVQKTESSPGQWFLYAEADASRIELCIRPLPAAEEKRINRKFGQKKAVVTNEGRLVENDPEKAERWLFERAALALVDSRGVEGRMLDDASAELYAKALGIPVKKDDLVTLDGKWTDAVKTLVFADAPQLALWISNKVMTLRVQEGLEEDEKKET